MMGTLPPMGPKLDQRDDAGHKHGVLQQADLQVGKLAACQAAGAGDDQQRGQVAHKHGKHMLQTQRDGVLEGHFCFKLVSCAFQLRTF